jgi:hypothetical protein
MALREFHPSTYHTIGQLAYQWQLSLVIVPSAVMYNEDIHHLTHKARIALAHIHDGVTDPALYTRRKWRTRKADREVGAANHALPRQ